MENETPKTRPAQRDHPLLNIIFNIAIPIFVLHKGGKLVGPREVVILALSFPILYGIYDYIKQRKANYISILGTVHVAVTGSFALLKLEGMWFAIKEASFPILVGMFVLFSAFTKSPFVKTLFLNPQLFRMDSILNSIVLKNTQKEFDALLKKGTILLSFSFVISAILNFTLAYHIFIPIDQALGEEQRAEVLNSQLAQMTTWSFMVILIPSMLSLGSILFYMLNQMQLITGLTRDEILHNS